MQILFSLPFLKNNPYLLTSVMQFIAFFLTVTCLYIYDLFQDYEEIKRVFKDRLYPGKQTIWQDLKLGALSWFIATPVVFTLSQISEMVTSIFFGKPQTQQIAVESLKQSTTSPISFITVLISILLFAPFLEEYLFRGVLQSWLRRKIGAVQSIFFTAGAFALLHFSPQQDWTNIPLITSLFAFGCYLGFVYEKSRSLFTPIVLHVTFNFVSVMRIILIEAN